MTKATHVPSSTISILGCGWLGLPLASHLHQLGFTVKGSTTSADKIPLLKKAGIIPHLMRIGAHIEGEPEFFTCHTLVITIPFKRNSPDPTRYQRQIQAVLTQAGKVSSLDFLIFTSSTSVYSDRVSVAREDVPLTPDQPRARVLWEIEQALLSDQRFAATVVRLGGLYGNDRPIGRILAGRQDVPHGSQPVNLIHQQDAVAVIARIITEDVRGEIFNAVADGHPTRRELYTCAAKKMGLPPPVFQEDEAGGKIVSNEKLKTRLNYEFAYPDPLAQVQSP